jgi:hypothetical protein
MGGFSVTRICSRTFPPACVAPLKNNFICVSNVKRDKRTRDVTPVWGVRMRERSYNFTVHFRVGHSGLY